MKRIMLLLALLFVAASAHAQKAGQYKAPNAKSLDSCLTLGNLANRIIYDRFHTNDLETSLRKVHELQVKMTALDEGAANLYAGVLLEYSMDAYRIPYTSDETEQRAVAERFIRSRLDNCIHVITHD